MIGDDTRLLFYKFANNDTIWICTSKDFQNIIKPSSSIKTSWHLNQVTKFLKMDNLLWDDDHKDDADI